MTDNAQYWLALTRIEGLGVRGAHRLVQQLGTPSVAYSTSARKLESCGLPARIAGAIVSGSGLREAETEVEAARKAECRILTYEDETYPPLLKQIADPPLALYLRGDATLLARYGVAMVGTRRPTAYGSSVAERLARDLAQRRLVIVSGLARGIDSASHRGALEARGATIAVLGSGIDIIYPRENRKLADQIAGSGCLVSEFPMGTAPTPENFPIRNRIISGLALGTVIVEAAEYSGSLITSRLALEQNREVFAVPGNITSPQSFGPNHLIKQGAKLVDQWMDVIEEFPASIRKQLLPEVPGDGEATSQSGLLFEESLTADQKAVFDALRVDQPMFIDGIFGALSVPQARVMAALLELEMSGLVRQLPGKNFIRKL